MSHGYPLPRILLVHPGASWSTADVYDGLLYGLRQHGALVDTYRLDTRISASAYWLRALWRERKKADPHTPKGNTADLMYHAGIGILEMALRTQAQVVLVVSAMLLHPDVVVSLKRAGLRVVVLFTESPYDEEKELRIAGMIDGGWTTERTSVQKFRAVNPNMGYLRHGWHPEKHYVQADTLRDVSAHDVVFVGSGFPERITFFNSIDWTGIDLGLYGNFDESLKPQVQACVRNAPIENERAAGLYRRAKIGLNLYRQYKIVGPHHTRVTYPHAESLSPRAYELAACGVFHVSDFRTEVREVFGDWVPTFTTPTEAAALMRLWLADDHGRRRAAAHLPACVAESSWVSRAMTVLGDLERLLHPQAAYAAGVSA